MDEKQRILQLIEDLMKNQTLSHFLKTYDFSLNLFGLKVSDNRHYFVRISCPQNEPVLWFQEEYIPQIDLKGDWIQNPPIESPRVERISPSVDYIPVDLTYLEFTENLKKFFDELRGYGVEHLKKGNPQYFNDDLERVKKAVQLF